MLQNVLFPVGAAMMMAAITWFSILVCIATELSVTFMILRLLRCIVTLLGLKMVSTGIMSDGK